MKINWQPLFLWIWQILRDAIEGFAHGCVIGTGVGTIATGSTATLAHSALMGGIIGAAKQALIYLSANPLPDVIVSSAQAVIPSPVGQPQPPKNVP